LSQGLGVVCIAALFALWVAQGDAPFGSDCCAQIFTVFAIGGWCWVLAIFGFGMKHLTRNSKYLAPLSEAVLPFYVLHQSILIYVSYGSRSGTSLRWRSGPSSRRCRSPSSPVDRHHSAGQRAALPVRHEAAAQDNTAGAGDCIVAASDRLIVSFSQS
jgi:hypothetical protein